MSSTKQQPKRKRYLIYIAPGIGDFMIAVPLFEQIKKADPTITIDVLICGDKDSIQLTKRLSRLYGKIDQCFYYSKKEIGHSLMMVMKCFRKSYDIGIVLEPSITKFLSAWPSRILEVVSKKTIGATNRYNNSTYDITLYRDRQQSVFEHEKDILQSLGLTVGGFGNTSVCFRYNEWEIIRKYPELDTCPNKKKVGLCLGAGPTEAAEDIYTRRKAWPRENWIELATILSRLGYGVFVFGGQEEKQLFVSIDCRLVDTCVNYIGHQTIEETMYALQKMSVVIGADTGMVHAAAVQGIPTISLFGPTYYENLKPYGHRAYYIQSKENCSPCFGSDTLLKCKKNICMKNIEVNMVLEKVQSILT